MVLVYFGVVLGEASIPQDDTKIKDEQVSSEASTATFCFAIFGATNPLVGLGGMCEALEFL